MCRTNIIRLWIYNIRILCITNNSDCGFTKIWGWPLFIQSRFDFWPSTISVIDPWLSSWPRTKIGVQNILGCHTLGLSRVHAGLAWFDDGSLHVEPLEIHSAGISFAKDPLDAGSSSFWVLPQRHPPARPLCRTIIKKWSKCLSLVYLHLTCTSVRYKWKMHGNNYSKIFIVKNLVCFNFVEVWAIQNFFTPKFSRSKVYHSLRASWTASITLPFTLFYLKHKSFYTLLLFSPCKYFSNRSRK